MAAQNGNGGSVLYMIAGTAVVDGINEWSIDVTQEPTEHIAFTETWKNNYQGPMGYSGSFSGRGDDGTTQDALRAMHLAGSAIALRLHVSATEYWNVGTALLTGQSDQLSREGIMERAWDFVGSGALTYV